MASLYKKPIVVRDAKTGEKTKKKSKKWWGRYRDALGRDRRVPLTKDKQAAQAMLNELVQKVEREKAGLIDNIDIEMRRPIAEHLADFERHKKSKNRSPQYVRDTMTRIRRVINDERWRTVAEINALKLETRLARYREHDGISIATSNHYLRAMKGFARWLTVNDRLRRNTLQALSLLNARTDRRRERRALSHEEFTLLLAAAETGPPVEGITGRDRAMLYLLAAWTGFRKGELGSLTPRSFRLDSEPPVVKVEAGYSKHRREDVQILHPDIVARLCDWFPLRNAEEREILFPVSEESCRVERKTSKMMEEDLAAARRAWLADADESDLPAMEASDFLLYQDHDRRYADFHALRHTFITNLARANVSPKTAQALARHSDINLTMNIYTHVDQDEQAAAIAKLPRVG